MKITADTNILVRAIVADDAKQARLAQALLESAERIAITPACLCEFVWVLARGYAIPRPGIAEAIRGLMDSAKVEANRDVIAAGLAVLEDGGDFADGVIAQEGAALGGDVFASFDTEAVALIRKRGGQAFVPA
ncbi:MAG: type II toxin-antitoxin system VapC family toxin [Hyphomonas sp.]|uniref:type II toxin-antitoxin system VapC family toxin n=1 Tax=Hyphomonas sp. TaxID=87 RepID=UPI0017D31A38|nr:type II toxin-antitoxin system VapC family toxin [Hyphomonas sp.]MBA3069468.1 type II toxin-antitoxin system VapC family toxin [Hyphomonas sp.]MBU3919442.1 type II toxin-antitoxin system VapC family toxin [Alphaproteobacteria bacterium]MBU4063850.1 type II toxin-antitoxin system VapC family toxin [Alphaproteobacteria bacterium]MBU4164189.1 type II toxin-antitoxin system VapC family toxin [Alphaproteobacteria bacterium]